MIDGHLVIDAHCHLGASSISGVDNTEEALEAALRQHSIDAALVLPHGFQDLAVARVHDRIARLAERRPGVFFGVASLSPRIAEADYRREAARCVRELGFRAIKLDPQVSALPINHKRAEIVFATARELGVAVMVHTGPGGFTSPVQAVAPAQAYPDVRIVLCHAGFVTMGGEAMVAAQVCPNIYLEPSWCMSIQVQGMVRRFGAARVLYGSDHVSNMASELAKIRALGFDASQLALVLGGTAAAVYGLAGLAGLAVGNQEVRL